MILPRIDLNRFLLKLLQRDHGLRAVDEETKNAAIPARAAEAIINAALQNLAGSSSIPIGTTDSGSLLSVDSSTLVASGLVVGATGAGKSRFLIGLVLQLLERLGGSGVEIELVDPKYETYDLLRLALAALWLRTSAWKRDELASRIRVIDWARDWITPSAPFERIGTDVSDASLAEGLLRARSRASRFVAVPSRLGFLDTHAGSGYSLRRQGLVRCLCLDAWLGAPPVNRWKWN